MEERALDALRGLSPAAAAGLSLAENGLLLVACLAAGQVVQRLCAGRRVSPLAPPVTRHELWLSASTVLLSAVVTFAGWDLWRRGLLRLGHGSAPLDGLVLLVVMDAAMYALHRVAHHPRVFPLLHAPHHRYDAPRPLTLFVLHPLETLAFGGLWLAVLWIVAPSPGGVVLYLTANLVFGLVGHLGVEPWPQALTKAISGAGFHAGHHRDQRVNFGFYLPLWDRLFRTGA